MAASDSCVPNLYADALESRAKRREALYSGLVRSFVTIARPAADLLSAATCAFFVYGLPTGASPSLKQRAIVSIVIGIVAGFSRVQQRKPFICNLIQIRETEAILRSAVLPQFVFLCVNLLLGLHLPAWAYVLSLAVMTSSMIVMRVIITKLLRRIHGSGYGADPVIIYGHSETTKQIEIGRAHV